MPPDEAPLAALTGQPGRPHPVAGVKFAADGTALPFHGNTVICHLPGDTAEHAALAAVAAELSAARPWGSKLAALAPSSYHMTVFDGVNELARRPEEWAADLPPDAPIESATGLFLERLRGLRVPPGFAMRPAGLATTRGGGTLLRLEPLDADTERQILGLREGLALLLGIRRPNHRRYGFHLTLNYSIAWMEPAEAEEFLGTLGRLGEAFAAHHPVLRFPAPEFCVFETLNQFLPVLRFA